jgi:predicted  nucleic acid-binding Zn-ribbon protein
MSCQATASSNEPSLSFPALERLQVLINVLNRFSEKLLIPTKNTFKLNGEKVKLALEESIGGKDGIAYIVLDENGHLFSTVLLEEAIASLACLKSIQKLIENDANKLNKPIVFITGKNEELKVVVILPSANQTIDLAKQHSIIYSLDPSNGRRDLTSQTKHGIFEMYLKKGSPENQIKPLFVSGIEPAENRNSVRKCAHPVDSGWWCIYYVLMLIHKGNDSFLESSNWEQNDVDMLKTVLMTHMESLNENEQNEAMQEENIANFNQFKQRDEQIARLFNERENRIRENLNSIESSSVEHALNKLQSEQAILFESSDKLKREIQQIEEIIKQGESLIFASKSNVDTIDSAFKRFVTGEEKKLIEARIEKKSEKSREAILSHNEHERRAFFEEEIKKLQEALKIEEEKHTEASKKQQEIMKMINKKKGDIKLLEGDEKTAKSQIDSMITNKKNLQTKKKSVESSMSKINQIPIDSDYNTLVSKLLKMEWDFDKTKLSVVKNALLTSDSNISELENEMNEIETKIKELNRKISENEVLISTKRSSISDLNRALSDTQSKVAHFEKKVEEYSPWIWSAIFYSSEYESFKKSLGEWQAKEREQSKSINDLENENQELKRSIERLESENQDKKDEKNRLEEKLESEERKLRENIDKLKQIRDSVLELIFIEIKKINESIKDAEISIETHRVDITSFNEKINRLNEEIRLQKDEIGKLEFTLNLVESNKAKLAEKINKTTKSLNVSVCLFIFIFVLLKYILNVCLNRI